MRALHGAVMGYGRKKDMESIRNIILYDTSKEQD